MWSRTSNALLDRGSHATIMWAERIHKERRRLGLEEPGGPTTADFMFSKKRTKPRQDEDMETVQDIRQQIHPEMDVLFQTALSDIQRRRVIEVQRPCIMEWRSKRKSGPVSGLKRSLAW